MTESIEVLVVGGGQAGLAISEHLSANGIPHLVLERKRIAERWRSERWDSLVANGPAWHDRFPGLTFSDTDPDGFPGKDKVVAYFEAYAERINAPIRTGVAVTSVTRNVDAGGFTAETSKGTLHAQFVVAATGPFQRPLIPPLVPESAGVHQLHSSAYRNPQDLPDGGVLVVGGGASGAQIADELVRAGRRVHLSIGPHDRPPRSYRGRDYCWWLGVLGLWELATPPEGAEHIAIAVSGAYGGATVDFRTMAERGVILAGRAEGYQDGAITFADDLQSNLAHGDANYLSVLEEADRYVIRNRLDLPEEPEAKVIGPDPDCVANPLRQLDLAKEDVHTIIWATGYGYDFGWLKVDAFDEAGRPQHQRGVSTEPGVYFLGLPWQSRRGSSFIWGVWHDAKFVADQIAIQRGYRAYDTHVRQLAAGSD
ncbi:MAG: NAD(P)/FAD-dependent oxidoreductase [Pseudomonadota bacterium]